MFNTNRVRSSVNAHADLPPGPFPKPATTVTAQSRRQRLAEAHAAFFAHANLEAGNALIALLKELGTISKDDDFLHIHKDCTTIVVVLKLGERLELDAYGCILRGV